MSIVQSGAKNVLAPDSVVQTSQTSLLLASTKVSPVRMLLKITLLTPKIFIYPDNLFSQHNFQNSFSRLVYNKQKGIIDARYHNSLIQNLEIYYDQR